MDPAAHASSQLSACAGDTHTVTDMQDLGTLMRVSEFRDSLSCKLHMSALKQPRIARAVKDTHIASKAWSALQALPDPDAICGMSPGQCNHHFLRQQGLVWKAVSAVICSLLEVLAQPGMEDLSERITTRPTDKAVDKSDQAQGTEARGIREYIKQESEDNPSLGQDLLHFLVLNLQDLLIALEHNPSAEVSGMVAESKHNCTTHTTIFSSATSATPLLPSSPL